MAATSKKTATPIERKPVVVIDDVHIIYKVFASGRRATRRNAGGGLLSKKMKLQEVHAVKGVSFTVYEGESIGIIGSNGSGKSSLMSALAGLTPTNQGSIYANARPNLLGVGGLLFDTIISFWISSSIFFILSCSLLSLYFSEYLYSCSNR